VAIRTLARFLPTLLGVGLLTALVSWAVPALRSGAPRPVVPPPGPLSFFVGTWRGEGTRADGTTFRLAYDVRGELPRRWLAGRAKQEAPGETAVEAADLWGVDSRGRVERFLAMGDGVFGSVSGDGWEGPWLLLAGSLQAEDRRVLVRQTIERLADDRFRAVWEQKDGDAWTVTSEETLHREYP
jgi:hypothetical protein